MVETRAAAYVASSPTRDESATDPSRSFRRRGTDVNAKTLVNLPDSLLSDIFDWVVGDDPTTYTLAKPLTQLCRRLSPLARHAGLKNVFLNRAGSATRLLALLRAHEGSARSIRQMVIVSFDSKHYTLVSMSQGIELARMATGLRSLDCMASHDRLVGFLREVGHLVAAMPLRRLTLEMCGYDDAAGTGGDALDEAELAAVINPLRARLQELSLDYVVAAPDVHFLTGGFTALRSFTATRMPDDKILAVINASPRLYSLSLDRFGSIISRIDAAALQRIEVLVFSGIELDDAAAEFEGQSFAMFPILCRAVFVLVDLEEHDQLLRSIVSPHFDGLDVDWATSTGFLEHIIEERALPHLARLSYFSPRGLWGPNEVDPQDDVESLRQTCSRFGIDFDCPD